MRLRLRAVGASLAAVLCATVARPAHAADPEPYAPVPLPAAAPVAPDPTDAILRRVLESGCRDGLPEVRGLAAAGGPAWAGTVARLCGEIRASRYAAAPVRLIPPPVRGELDGRPAIVIASAAYGVWLGIAADVLFGNDSIRGAIIPPLVGMGAGIGLSLLATANRPIDNGQAWTIITGMEYGSVNGALWAGGLDFDNKEVVGTALATGLASSAIGLLVADKLHPRQGDVEVVRSGLLWGTVTGLLTMAAASPHSSESTIVRVGAVSMDLGFLAGLALAASFDVSRNRDLVIDAGTLGGGFVGFGIAWLATAGNNMSGSPLAGGALAGMYVGMLTTIFLTRHMDDEDDGENEDPPVAALYGRDARGRWTFGTPSAAPVLDGQGRRVIGATLTALGGSF